MQNRILLLISILVLITSISLFRFPETETIIAEAAYVIGSADTVYLPGRTDTLIKEIKEKVFSTVYISDTSQYSSLITDTIITGNASAAYKLTTYPAIDSFALALSVNYPEIKLLRTDTFTISRVDTLIKMTPVNEPFYENFITGFIAGIIAIFTFLIFH